MTSTMMTAPSHSLTAVDTSLEKSIWPGESIRFTRYSQESDVQQHAFNHYQLTYQCQRIFNNDDNYQYYSQFLTNWQKSLPVWMSCSKRKSRNNCSRQEFKGWIPFQCWNTEGHTKHWWSSTGPIHWAVIDWDKVLRPTRHKIGHFKDVLLSQSLGYVGYWKTKSNTTKANMHL